MQLTIPDIPESEQTPLVRQLLDLLHPQQQRIRQLEDEIASLKRLPTRPTIRPSALERPQPKPPAPGSKRPGSAKRPKTQQLTIHRELLVLCPDVPPGSAFKGYQDFVVQELILRPEVTRYRRARWRTPDGRTLLAPLPADVLPGRHFGPNLVCFILHQYHHQHVTQPLLLEQLRQLGLDLSAGQLSALLTEGLDDLHQEKDALLPAGLRVSPYVQADDTGARHAGANGFCLQVGNELFASFASTDSKSRRNFLEVLRAPHTDYVVNEVAQAYCRDQGLSQALTQALAAGDGTFADAASWQAHLVACGLRGERYTRIATEGALLGSLVAHGVSPELVVLSDGAPQFDVLVHACCWLHAERPLARMVPFSESHRQAIEQVRGRIGALYQQLKASRQAPAAEQRPLLEAAFDALCAARTGFASVNGVRKELASHQAELLRVLERPEVPLHTNISEGHLRDYVKKRKISGSTRRGAGRRCRDRFASLQKTCRRLGVNFWAYLQDRVRGRWEIPRLAELLRRRAAESGAGNMSAAPA